MTKQKKRQTLSEYFIAMDAMMARNAVILAKKAAVISTKLHTHAKDNPTH